MTELLDAKYTFLNQRLAEFYGIPNVYGPQFRRVELTDPNRGGVLGQGSLLTVTSYPNRTSVVQRGKWVLENLLGTPPPPPPPNVPSLDPHGKDGKMSMRQAMEMHRANPVCASCHSRMDPIGFALENFDGIGEWRDKDAGNADRCLRQVARWHRIQRRRWAQASAAHTASRRVHLHVYRKTDDLRPWPGTRVL